MNKGLLSFIGAVISGLILGLIHPPYGLPYVGILGFPLALWMLKFSKSPKNAGYGLGFGYFLITMIWIKEPFQIEAEQFGAMGYPAWVLMSAGLAIFWIPIFVFHKHGSWAIAAIFASIELLRGWIFTGFPWALIGYGFVDTPIALSAQFVGSYGLSTALVYVSLSLFGPGEVRQRLAGLCTALMLFVPYFIVGEPDNKIDEKFKVTLVQANISQTESFDDNRAQEFLDTQLAMSKGNADLVIWPESAIRFSPDYDEGLNALIAQNLQNQHLLYGTIHYSETGEFYNSAYLISSSGEIIYRYDKQHLVPFGEYIPFGNWLKYMGIATQTVTRFSMSKGELTPWPQTDLPPINILICYEGIFPKYGFRDGAFIALITNDSWFGKAGGPSQHLIAARFRAIESGKPLARVGKTGISAIVNAKGEIVKSVPLDTKGVITSEIGARYSSTIYGLISDWPIYIFIITAFAIIWRRARKS